MSSVPAGAIDLLEVLAGDDADVSAIAGWFISELETLDARQTDDAANLEGLRTAVTSVVDGGGQDTSGGPSARVERNEHAVWTVALDLDAIAFRTDGSG